MVNKREKRLSVIMVVVQVVLTILMFLLTTFILSEKHHIHNTIALIIQISLMWSFLLYHLNLGIIFRATELISMLRGYLVTVFFGCLFLYFEVFIISLFRPIYYTLNYITVFGIINLTGLILFKLLFHRAMLYIRRKGYNKRNVLFVANSENTEFISSFIKAKDWGYEVHSIVSADNEMKKHFKNVQIIKSDDALSDYIQSNPIDDIFYCLPIVDKLYDIEKLLSSVKTIGVALYVLQEPDIKSGLFRKPSLMNMNYVARNTVNDKYLGIKLKDFFDIVFSIVALFIVSPLMFIIALIIKLNDGGPVFFIQERVGLNGRLFKCYKFRTMIVNAEAMLDELKHKNEADGPVFKIGNDPRITKIGRFLRKTSLDELPQFINVLRGEMSVVGPRPPLMKEVHQYEKPQLRRLSMKPGITCSWQVWGRHEVSFDEWMQMDLDYIDNWSLWFDIRIMAATITVILKANGQ